MILKKDKEIVEVNMGGRPIAAIYKGVYTVWQYVRSCFGKGFWVNEKPWLNKEGWK